MTETQIDLFIIGGGINGAGIAADAAGRGLSVMLCESHDLASGTSSASSKLIHGGLRYLEQYEFKLVKKALHEREVLLSKAPHIITPMEFVLPHDKHLRPAWMLRAGLFLYDNLAKRKTLPASRKINLEKDKEGAALKPHFKVGFSYADCWVNDARLVVLNAKAAEDKGAVILVRTACIKAVRVDGAWEVTTKERDSGIEKTIRAKALVNAAGPWVGQVISDVVETKTKHHIKMVKGSHIVIPKLYDGDHAYILQNADGRIVFAIPYESNFTLIGTTDMNYTADPRNVSIHESEKEYLCKIIGTYFNKSITLDDIVWDYSGIRPLYDDEKDDLAKVTRDYRFEIEDHEGQAPLLSIFGGKITTYRVLAENAISKLSRYFPQATGEWTATSPLPGGDIQGSLSDFLESMSVKYPWLPRAMLDRMSFAYGTLIEKILEGTEKLEDLGKSFEGVLTEKEAKYLVDFEWARSADDILWRRSKLGLHTSKETQAELQDWVHHYLVG